MQRNQTLFVTVSLVERFAIEMRTRAGQYRSGSARLDVLEWPVSTVEWEAARRLLVSMTVWDQTLSFALRTYTQMAVSQYEQSCIRWGGTRVATLRASGGATVNT